MFRTYATAVGGLEIDVKDTSTGASLLKNWLVSEHGGLRWAWNIARFLAILVGFWILSGILSGLVGRALGRIKGASSLLRTFAADFDAGGVSGKVHSMNMLSTTIRTPDNKVIIVPNAEIGNDTITNSSASDTRPVDFKFGIGYRDDSDKAEAILRRIVTSHPLVLKDPPALIKLSEPAESSVNFSVRPWVKRSDYWTVLYDITAAVKKEFDREDVSFPFPQRDIHVHQVGG